MIKKILSLLLVFTMTATIIGGAVGASAAAEEPQTIYATSNVHLDTVWSWDLEQTVKEFIKKTFEGNFILMDLFPDYQFNFEGAYRYQLMEEYYPEEFERLKNYAAAGQWNPAGSAIENGDVNAPSPEALFRNFLYGNNYFEDTLGVRNKDVFLPDCFGFGYALPSVAAHAGLLGFTTQKLSWGNTFPNGNLPFDMGRWYGPDGNYIVANIRANGYGDGFQGGMRNDGSLSEKLGRNALGKVTALYGIYGDRGGAPTYTSAKVLTGEQSGNTSNNVNVKIASTDQVFKDIAAASGAAEKLPAYDGELLLHTHGSGSYTSRAITKRWNRRAEQIADATERANVAADWLGTVDYPTDLLKEIWTNVIAHQFHDDMPGTSNSTIYNRSWNEYMVDIMRFAAEYESGVSGVVSMMNTVVESGVPVVVNNPLAAERTAVVDATVKLPVDSDFVKVYDTDGTEVLSQSVKNSDGTFEVSFLASVDSLGYRTYNVIPTTEACRMDSDLSLTEGSAYIMENEKYTVTVGENGDISSVVDKTLGDKELLSSPIRLGQFATDYAYWAAWEIPMSNYWNKAPTRYVTDSSASFRIVENGPARISLEITRKHRSSTYVQTVSLEAGGQIVAIDNNVEWYERATLLKAVFDFTAKNPVATYDLGLGVIERGNNVGNEATTGLKAEVPHQKWADLTNTDGDYGVSILNDGKIGIDKPGIGGNNGVLRLSLIFTPNNDFTWTSENNNVGGDPISYAPAGQSVQEFGENRFAYAIYSHNGTFGQSDVQIEAEAFNQPMNAFQTVSHEGALGSDYSFGSISNDKVLVRAIKQAERSDEIVVRFNEGSGSEQNGVIFTLGEGVESAREINASEEALGAAEVVDGKLQFDIGAYGVKSFALTLKAPGTVGIESDSADINLPYNIDAYSGNGNKNDGGMNKMGDCFPVELLPDNGIITAAGIAYKLGNTADGEMNAVKTSGQTISIPAGYSTLKILAASVGGDKTAVFNVGGKNVSLNIGDYAENIAEWDLYDLGQTGYVKNQTPAFFGTHRHTAGKDNVAASTYMFSYELDISGASEITLPTDGDIIIFAATAVNDENSKCKVATSLHDERERAEKQIVEGEPAGSLVTGFEDGDPQPILNRADNSKNVSNFKSEIVTDPTNPSNKVFKISGNDTNSGDGSYAYTDLFHLSGNNRITVVAGMKLSFDYYAENELGRYCSIDLEYDSGNLRDGGAVSSEGIRMHPSTPKANETGRWVHVECVLSDSAEGKTINQIKFPYDRNEGTGEFTAYLDNLSISVPDDIWEDILNEAESIDRTIYGNDSLAVLDAAIAKFKAVTEDTDATDAELLDIYDYMKLALSAIKTMNRAEAADDSMYAEGSLDEIKAAVALMKTAWTDADTTMTNLEFAVTNLNDALEYAVIAKNPYDKINSWDVEKTENISALDKDASGNPSNLGGISNNAMAVYKQIDFGEKGADRISIEYSGWATGADANVEVRVGSEAGTLIGVVNLPETRTGNNVDWSAYTTVSADLTKAITGKQDIYLIFNASGGKQHVCNFKSLSFEEKTEKTSLSSNKYTIDTESGSIDTAGEEISVAEFKKTLNQTVSVYTADGRVAVNDMLGAGMKVITADGTSFTVGKAVVIPGDLTGDGGVNVNDVVVLRQIIMSGRHTAEQIAAGDMDKNGTLNVSDVVALRQLIMSNS